MRVSRETAKSKKGMSQRVGEKRPRSSGRESDGFTPPRKQSRVNEEEESDGYEESEFTFTQVQAQSQDEREAVERTKEMKLVSPETLIRVWQNTHAHI